MRFCPSVLSRRKFIVAAVSGTVAAAVAPVTLNGEQGRGANIVRSAKIYSADERIRVDPNRKIVDVHGHLWLGSAEKNKETILKICTAYNVKKLFISTLQGYYPDESEIRNCNDATYGFMQERPGLIKGLAYINPANHNCMDELKRCISELGMSGIKLWVATRCDDERVNPVAEAAIRYDIPVEIHSFKKTVGQLEHESTGIHVENLGKRYPELKIIMAHIGSNVYDAVKCVKEYNNIFIDFSGSIMRRDDLDYTIKHVGVSRILFGSDMPGSFENCVGQVEGAAITGEERRMIFYGNACKLFKMEDMES